MHHSAFHNPKPTIRVKHLLQIFDPHKNMCSNGVCCAEGVWKATMLDAASNSL